MGAAEIFFEDQVPVPDDKQSTVLRAALGQIKCAFELRKVEAGAFANRGRIGKCFPSAFRVRRGIILRSPCGNGGHYKSDSKEYILP